MDSATEEPYTPTLLVTANVGSIFEDPEHMLKSWVAEFLKTVKNRQPHFVALHCQEIGGKNYEESMKYVEDFVRTLMASEELMKFDRVRVFLDEDYASCEKFTALGSLYFIHEAVKSIQIWDFKARSFSQCIGKEVHSGNIETVGSKEKHKFPADFYPECKWSRKGFIRTRWRLNGTIFDLLNVHLFHDASNLLSIESYPSVYTTYRHMALEHLLQRIQEEYMNPPFFIFGDFNFRCDTQAVVKRLTSHTIPYHVKNNKSGETSKIIYKEANGENNIVLTVGKKEFDHHGNHEALSINSGKLLREFDVELQPFLDRMFEFEVTFPPSYPFSEDVGAANTYMRTRCPSWCDRILLSRSAKSLVYKVPDSNPTNTVEYNVIGCNICMGDHKPVFLSLKIICGAGRNRQIGNSLRAVTPSTTTSSSSPNQTIALPPLVVNHNNKSAITLNSDSNSKSNPGMHAACKAVNCTAEAPLLGAEDLTAPPAAVVLKSPSNDWSHLCCCSVTCTVL